MRILSDVGPHDGLQNEPEPPRPVARLVERVSILGVAAWLSERLGRVLPGRFYRAGRFDGK